MRIRGRTAIVTGASSGIGHAVAIRLARQGASVALVARRRRELDSVASAIRADGGQAIVVPCDVTDLADVLAANNEVSAKWGAVDILVNAAGVGIWKNFEDISEAEHHQMMNVNYWGSFNWIRRVLPGMVDQRRGRIVNISSASGKFALSVTSGYSASKFAITGLSEALHRQYLGTGIGVSCIHPGSVGTSFWDESRIPKATLPPLVRYAPKLSPASAARSVIYAIRFGFPSLTPPIFVNLLAKLNGIWLRFGDLMLWRWFVPALVSVLAARFLYRAMGM